MAEQEIVNHWTYMLIWSFKPQKYPLNVVCEKGNTGQIAITVRQNVIANDCAYGMNSP